MARALITLPSKIRIGETIEIRALIAHPMETGYRRSNDGIMLKRNLIRKFTCQFEGIGGTTEAFFSANLHAAVAANPYLAFSFMVIENGILLFTWSGDEGFNQSERRSLKIT
jgi:sulfur-oxidizing protein SoxZ